MMDKLVDLWYCKSLKHTGKPIMVRDFKGGKTTITNTNKWSMKLYDKDGKKILLRIHYQNTTGKPKAQGATSMLEILKE